MTLPTALVAATDFSLDARRAARRAALLAQEHHVPLTLVHVLDVDALTALAARLQGKADIQEAMAGQARIQLGVAAEEVHEQVGVAAGTELRQGAPLAELADAGARAGMLVVGARGAHAIRELAVGTTADRLLRKAQAPLLVVKAEPAGPYRRVLALVDFSPASEAALAFAAKLAPRAALRLLHAFELPYEGHLLLAGVAEDEIHAVQAAERQRSLEQMHAVLRRLGPQHERATVAVEHGEVRHQALEEVRQFAPDLLVVGKQGRSTLEDFLLGSVTRAMLSQSPCDVLVAPGARVG